MSQDSDYEFKIILIGDSGVGKTSLTVRFTLGKFKGAGAQTVYCDLFTKNVVVGDKKVKLCIWDTAGQERFQSVVQEYFRNVDGVVLVYDVTNILTFNALKKWLSQLREISCEVVGLIVGNKIDHPKGKSVTRNQVKEFARDEDLEFLESSAKSGKNVDKIFEQLTLRILQKKNKLPSDGPSYAPVSTNKSSLETDSISEVSAQQTVDLPAGMHPSHSQNQGDLAIAGTSDADDLPPVIPLSQSVEDLRLERERRMSSDSVSSLAPEYYRALRLRESVQEQKPKSTC